MNCQDCETRLSDYIEHAPSVTADRAEAVRDEMDLHFKECQACSELLEGMTQVIEAGALFPAYEPPPWLATRIIANTPQDRKDSLRDVLSKVWRSLGEPRTALAIFTATVVIGWFGGVTARASVFNRAQSAVSCAYDRAVRTYYRSPMVIEIHSQIQSTYDRILENS